MDRCTGVSYGSTVGEFACDTPKTVIERKANFSMGWYHVNRTGKGMVLGDKRSVEFNKDFFMMYFSKRDGTNYTFPTLLRKIAEENAFYAWWGDKTDERLLNRAKTLLASCLCEIFEEKYGFPRGSFDSVTDYDDDVMIFCCMQWPPKEYNEALATLTEDKLEKMLQEFLVEATGNEEYRTKKLEICEEYIKE